MNEIRVPGTESYMYPDDKKKVFGYQDRSVHGTYWKGFHYAAAEEISYAKVLQDAIENDSDSYHYREAVQYMFDKGFITEIQYKAAGRSLRIVYKEVGGNGAGTHLSAGTIERAKIVAKKFVADYPEHSFEFTVYEQAVYAFQTNKSPVLLKWIES